MTSSMGEAIASRYQQQADDAAEAAPFVPDPVLERHAAELERLRESSPTYYANANFGGLRGRVETYLRRKADHEEKNR